MDRIDWAEYERRKSELDPVTRRLIEEQLGEASRIYEANPLQAFFPYPKQQVFLGARDRTKAFFGGNRAGKTEIGVVDDLIQCVDRSCLPAHLLPFKRWEPPFFCRVVFPKFGQGELAVMEKVRSLVPKDQLRGGDFDKALEKQPNLRLHFKNGSWIVFNTGDQDRDVHAGVKLHRVHFDEEPQGEKGFGIYQENRNRLIDYAPESQMMFTMTPQSGLTWTYDEIWSAREAPGVFCVVASMLDNPHIPREEVEKRILELSEEERLMLVEGQFAAFHGRVMDVREHHKVEAPSLEHVRGLDAVYVGIDPGWRRGGVLWVGFDRDNVALAFDELYPERLTPEQIVPLIREKNAFWGIEPLYIIDPSSSNASLTSGDDVASMYGRLGIYPSGGNNRRLAGSLQLKARLQRGGLFISRECRSLLHETDRWLVATDEIAAEQKSKVKGAGGEFATIGPDHLCDPLRYVCMERLWYEAPVAERPARRRFAVDSAPDLRAFRFPGGSEAPMGAMS